MDAFFHAAAANTQAEYLASDWLAILEPRGAAGLCWQVGENEWWVGSRRGERVVLGESLIVFGKLRMRGEDRNVLASLATLMAAWLQRMERFAATSRRAQSERKTLRASMRDVRARELVGTSPAMVRVRELVRTVAPHLTSVAIFGESGTGKELVARMLHDDSGRSGPFMAMNCSALSPSLVDAELFGHARGAFTGAESERRGLLLAATDGTLFLDEVAELSLDAQARLLRALEARRIRAIGAEVEEEFNARVVCATHRDLKECVRMGRFREDLYYRLVRFEIQVPPLRERSGDIPALVEQCLRRFAAEQGRSIPRIDEGVLRKMSAMAWPGNVRQLQNEVERALLMSDAHLRWTAPEVETTPDGTLASIVRAALVDALVACRGRVYGEHGAAKRLGIPPSTLQAKMTKHVIERTDYTD